MKITDEMLKEIALEYLNTDISIASLAAKHNIGKATLVASFKGTKEIKLPKSLQEQIDAKKKVRFQESKSTSGNKGHTTLSKEQIINCARIYISGQYTFEEIATAQNISIGTLSNYFTIDNLGEELYNQVRQQIEINKANATNGIHQK